MRLPGRIALAGMMAILLVVTTAAGAVAAPTPAGLTLRERIHQAIKNQWGNHPGDFIGLEKVAKRSGSDRVLFSAPKAGLRSVSGAEMQAAQDKARVAGKSAGPGGARPLDGVPNDAFAVTGEWVHIPESPQNVEGWEVYGYWQYGAFLGSGSPDNVSGIATENVDLNCWKSSSDWADSWDYLNDYTGYTGYRYSASSTSSVWNFTDTSDLTYGQSDDHGDHGIYYERVGTGCSDKMAANSFFEHNQDGTAIANISISIGFLTVSYDPSGDPLTLQKSTGVYNNQ